MNEDGRVKGPGVKVGDPRPDTVNLLELHKKNASGIVRAAFMDVDAIFADSMGYSGSLLELLAIPSDSVGLQRYNPNRTRSRLPEDLQGAISSGHILTSFSDERGNGFCYQLDDAWENGLRRRSFSARFHTLWADPGREIDFRRIRRVGKNFVFDVPAVKEASGQAITEYDFFGRNILGEEQALRIRKRDEIFDLTLDYSGLDEDGNVQLTDGQRIDLREADALWRGVLRLEEGRIEWKNAPAGSTGDVPQVIISEDGTQLIIQGVSPKGGFVRPIKGIGYDYENNAEVEGPVASFPVSGNIYDFLRQALSLVPDSVQIDSESPRQRHLHG